MHRLTARFLLLLALVGTLVPVVLAATATPQHDCCLRKAAHQCHGTGGPESDQRTVRDTTCCHRDGCRAVTTSQWASLQPWAQSVIDQNVEAHVAESRTASPATKLFSSQSTRAPPQISIA